MPVCVWRPRRGSGALLALRRSGRPIDDCHRKDSSVSRRRWCTIGLTFRPRPMPTLIDLDFDHLENLIAVVVDDLDCDLARGRRGEGAGDRGV